MNRRKFLSMLGLAPVVAKAAPFLKRYWAGTSIEIPSILDVKTIRQIVAQLKVADIRPVNGYFYTYHFVNREGEVCTPSPVYRDATLGDVEEYYGTA